MAFKSPPPAYTSPTRYMDMDSPSPRVKVEVEDVDMRSPSPHRMSFVPPRLIRSPDLSSLSLASPHTVFPPTRPRGLSSATDRSSSPSHYSLRQSPPSTAPSSPQTTPAKELGSPLRLYIPPAPQAQHISGLNGFLIARFFASPPLSSSEASKTRTPPRGAARAARGESRHHPYYRAAVTPEEQPRQSLRPTSAVRSTAQRELGIGRPRSQSATSRILTYSPAEPTPVRPPTPVVARRMTVNEVSQAERDRAVRRRLAIMQHEAAIEALRAEERREREATVASMIENGRYSLRQR